jgi:hypothetical protein
MIRPRKRRKPAEVPCPAFAPLPRLSGPPRAEDIARWKRQALSDNIALANWARGKLLQAGVEPPAEPGPSAEEEARWLRSASEVLARFSHETATRGGAPRNPFATARD